MTETRDVSSEVQNLREFLLLLLLPLACMSFSACARDLLFGLEYRGSSSTICKSPILYAENTKPEYTDVSFIS